MIWRLILEKIASLTELETTWNLDDLIKANAYLDMKADVARAEMAKQQKGSKR